MTSNIYRLPKRSALRWLRFKKASDERNAAWQAGLSSKRAATRKRWNERRTGR